MRARDRVTGQQVAIKKVKMSNEHDGVRFVAPARARRSAFPRLKLSFGMRGVATAAAACS